MTRTQQKTRLLNGRRSAFSTARIADVGCGLKGLDLLHGRRHRRRVSVNPVMCRNVLVHNGGREAEIVDHLASIAASGVCLNLADVDMTALRNTANDPDIEDLFDRYLDFQRARGNDLSVGLGLEDLLIDAGLAVERYACRRPAIQMPPAHDLGHGRRERRWSLKDLPTMPMSHGGRKHSVVSMPRRGDHGYSRRFLSLWVVAAKKKIKGRLG